MTANSDVTVLLVHGAFADASGWAEVIRQLQYDGVVVSAPANPLRGIAADGAYLASVVNQTDGPVLLVGHSYGGATITAAGAMAQNVIGLVYVSALALDQGESPLELTGRFPDTLLSQSLQPATYPDDNGEPASEFYLQSGRWRDVLAGGVSDEITAIAAVCQRPVAAVAFQEPLALVPAWRTLPSWYVIATDDDSLHPDAQRFMAQRAGAKTVEIGSSHAIPLTHPEVIVDQIRAALRQLTHHEGNS